MGYSFDYMLTGLQIKKLLERSCEKEMAGCGLRQVELEILCYISDTRRGDTAREILRDWHLSKAHISKSVDNLRRTDCITLSEDAGDHRCLHIRPTPKGLTLVAQYDALRDAFFKDIFSGLTDEERMYTGRAVQKIQKNLRDRMEE